MLSINVLKQAFADALGISMETPFDALEFRSIKEWDSVAHIGLVAEIELAFDVMLSTEDVINLSSFYKAREILATHGIELDG